MTDPGAVVQVLTFLTMAAIPWCLAAPAVHWMPRMQTRVARRRYLLVIAVVSLICTALAFVPGAEGIAGFLWWAVALFLSVRWFAFSRTDRGREQLRAARYWAERPGLEPPAGMQPWQWAPPPVARHFNEGPPR